MVNALNPATLGVGTGNTTNPNRPASTVESNRSAPRDTVSFGQSTLSSGDALNIVTERAYERLRAVVAEARDALGLAEGAELDTSPEATANRIADFALNFFSQYAENNGLEDNEEGRRQFADFIGGAIAQGIDEARGILGALDALGGGVSENIDTTADIIQQRLDDFVANGLG